MTHKYPNDRQFQALECPCCGDLHIRPEPMDVHGDGINILFLCESCGGVSQLVIEPHKGWTRMQWLGGAPIVIEVV